MSSLCLPVARQDSSGNGQISMILWRAGMYGAIDSGDGRNHEADSGVVEFPGMAP